MYSLLTCCEIILKSVPNMYISFIKKLGTTLVTISDSNQPSQQRCYSRYNSIKNEQKTNGSLLVLSSGIRLSAAY